VCGSTIPTQAITTYDNAAFIRFTTNSGRNDIRFRLNFSSRVEGSFLNPINLPNFLIISRRPTEI